MQSSAWHVAMVSGAGNCFWVRIGRLMSGTAVAGRAWLTAAGAAGTASATKPAAAATGTPRTAAHRAREGAGARSRVPPPRAFLREIIDMGPPQQLPGRRSLHQAGRPRSPSAQPISWASHLQHGTVIPQRHTRVDLLNLR